MCSNFIYSFFAAKYQRKTAYLELNRRRSKLSNGDMER